MAIKINRAVPEPVVPPIESVEIPNVRVIGGTYIMKLVLDSERSGCRLSSGHTDPFLYLSELADLREAIDVILKEVSS
jgi:hypothetical protein